MTGGSQANGQAERFVVTYSSITVIDIPSQDSSLMQPAPDGEHCIIDGALHTFNQSTATGTAFAISYTSNLSDVTPESLVVFTVAGQ